MKADISGKLLEYLVIAGAVSIAATSPYFLYGLAKIIAKELKYRGKQKQRFSNAFYYLKKNGLIMVEKDSHDIVITPTEKGIKALKRHKMLDLKIDKPKKWDGKIRIVAFDIPNTQRIKRNAFRRKLKELGFYSSQKSVWLHPFDCEREIKILIEFFGLNGKQIQFFTAEKIQDDFLFAKIKGVYRI